MIDLDYFKKVNDKFGHLEGDKSLIMFTKTIANNLDDSTLFGRFGGEEFVIFIQNISGDCAYEKSEKLRKSIENNLEIIKCTISIGLAIIYPEEEIDSILKKADTALYKAKETGRNKTVKFNDA